MAVDLSVIAPPDRCAVLTMEMQRGVAGDLSAHRELVEAAERAQLIPNTARLLAVARRLGIPVVHCTAEFRADRAGSAVNCQLLAAMLRNPEHLLTGTPAADLIPDLGPEPSDLVSPRFHGIAPFTATSLDIWLRNLGVGTVVATGVSVNLGVLGMAIEAVNLGYQVVVPRDAVAGLPQQYADDIIDNTFPLIATVTTVDDLTAAWSAAGPTG